MRSKALAASPARPAPSHASPDRGIRGGAPSGGLAAAALGLQRTLGNAMTGRLLAGALVQPKLTINRPGDRYEQEADRVADQVMRMPKSQPHGDRAAVRQPAAAGAQPDRTMQADSPGAPAPRLDPAAAAAIQSVHQHTGRPLDPSIRADMGARLGHDFSQVRVHDDAAAAEAARAIQARAYTIGRDVAFGAGEYAPHSPHGRRLLAHELAHVVQQHRPSGTPAIQRSPWDVERPRPKTPPTGSTLPAPGAPLPSVVEIGERDMISTKHQALVQFADTVSKALTAASTIYITCFWDTDPASEAGVDIRTAAARARMAKAVLSEFGIPSDTMVVDWMDRNVMSDPDASPAGLVRIAFYPAGFQPLTTKRPEVPRLPPLPPPRSNLPSAPRVTPRTPPVPSKEVKPRKGGWSDLAKAVLALPPVKKAVDEAKGKALDAFRALPPDVKFGLINGAVAIALGAGAALAKHPDAVRSLLEEADGIEIPIPSGGLPGELKIQLLGKERKFDPHAPIAPDKPQKPAGPGLMLHYELKFGGRRGGRRK
jgi:hypothetical protein